MVVAPVGLVVEAAVPADYPRIAELTVGVYTQERYAPPEYARELADVAARAHRAELLVARTEPVDAGAADVGAPGPRAPGPRAPGRRAAGGRVVGSVALVLAGEFGEVTRSDAEAAFRMLVVDPAARGCGVGELLVRSCLDRARAAGKGRMVLSTDPRMTAAHRLYGRLGFTRLPERDWSPLPGIELQVYARDL